MLHLFFVVFRLELTNEALLGQSERLQERLKRLEEEGEISSRIIQVLFLSRLIMMVMVVIMQANQTQ